MAQTIIDCFAVFAWWLLVVVALIAVGFSVGALVSEVVLAFQ